MDLESEINFKQLAQLIIAPGSAKLRKWIFRRRDHLLVFAFDVVQYHKIIQLSNVTPLPPPPPNTFIVIFVFARFALWNPRVSS